MRIIAAILLALGLAGCVVYAPPAPVDPVEASFNAAVPNVWVSLIVTMLANGWDSLPNPGMLVPCEPGSRDR